MQITYVLGGKYASRFKLNGLAALETARATKATTVTHVVALAQGGEGFMPIHPLFVQGRLDGFIVGVFEVQAMLERAARRGEFAGGYALEVFDGERKLISRNDERAAEVRWHVRMWPTPAFVPAARHKHQMAVCYLDRDKFKYVNDTFGHETGDQLLLAVAQRLLGSVRDTDTVARLGGDEFAIVLSEGVDPVVVATVLTRLLHNIGAPLDLNGHQFAISGSIGVAIYPEHGLDAQTLLKCADEAMYHAKQAGRNNWRACVPPEPAPSDAALDAGALN